MLSLVTATRRAPGRPRQHESGTHRGAISEGHRPCAVCTFAQTRLPSWRGIARRRVISMTMTAQEYRAKCQFAVAGVDMGVIQAPKRVLCFTRYELTDYEWAAVRFGVPLPK